MERALVQRMAPLAVALAFMACNRPDPGPTAAEPVQAQASNPGGLTPADRAAFEKEARAIKARFKDDAFAAAMRDLLARYRQPIPAALKDGARPMNGPELPGKGVLDEAGKAAVGEALAKSAANVTVWKSVKEFDISAPYAVYASREVKPNQRLGIYTDGGPFPNYLVDPVIVAFYRASGSSTSPMYAVKLIGYDDDSNGDRNAAIRWTNNTGSTQVVEIVAFAYNQYTTGLTYLSHFINGVNVQTVKGTISAIPTESNLAVDAGNCDGPIRSRLRLRRLSGGGYGTSLLAIDAVNNRGGIIKDTPLSTTLNLGEVLTEGQGNFVLAYLPNVEGDTFGTNRYYGWQEDQYSCAQ